jgi:asparagine synthase (glutamine-hydrolysing)
MCGIVGFFDPGAQTPAGRLAEITASMTEVIKHRGPDDTGVWTDETVGVALGFRRLAILDLSPAGHQPMVSSDGRYVIVFNGEVYNFAHLRGLLLERGHSFRGTSDTEVMLAAISEWGILKAVQQFNGMFAFALWDRQEKTLALVRDRLGIKPLYYGWVNGVFMFASELKALRAFPGFDAPINRDALGLYFRHNYIPAPYSIYTGVNKLQPGVILTLPVGARQTAFNQQVYWSVRQVAEAGIERPFEGCDQDAVSELDALLKESVRLRMVADVPLGAFLSGGIDSSMVVALMQAQSNMPVQTFTIGFHEEEYNEARFASEIADYLGTKHTEHYLKADEVLKIIPDLAGLYDEPFGDASQAPTLLVSKLARQHVTVSLSGDGGDELFAGYDHYGRANQVWRWLGWAPNNLRHAAASGIKGAAGLLGGQKATRRARRLGDVLGNEDFVSYYKNHTSQWKNHKGIVEGGGDLPTPYTDKALRPQFDDRLNTMMYLDQTTYLPDDILVKVDRASMGVSLEARVPLLDDHRVIEFAWRLPLSMKVRGGVRKWLLRQVLYQYVPPSLVERPKMGFSVPVGDWLRGGLRQWAGDLLDESRLKQGGYFNAQAVSEMWRSHVRGEQNWSHDLWNVIMFQAWHDHLR